MFNSVSNPAGSSDKERNEMCPLDLMTKKLVVTIKGV